MVNSAATGRLPSNIFSPKIRSGGQKNISQVEGPSSTSQNTTSPIKDKVLKALTTALDIFKGAKVVNNTENMGRNLFSTQAQIGLKPQIKSDLFGNSDKMTVSDSKISHKVDSTPASSSSSKPPGMVSKFLKNVSNFFKRLFFGAKPQPNPKSSPPPPNISTADANSVSTADVNSTSTKSSDSVKNKTIDVSSTLTPKLQQRFGVDSLLMLSNKANAAGVSKDLESLNKMSENVTSENINDFNSKVDTLLNKLSFHDSLTSKLQTKFGVESLAKLKDKVESVGLSGDLAQVEGLSNHISVENLQESNDKVDVFLSKLIYHEVLNDTQAFVSNSKLNDFTTVNQLKETLVQQQTEFPSSNGEAVSGRTASDYDNRLVGLKQTVQSFKTAFAKELSATDSKLKKDISVIKQNVMKSTETYVKSGEFDQKKMVADLISRNKQFVNMAFNSSRITSSLEQVKHQLEGNDIQNVRDNLKAIRDIYDQYKGVATSAIQSTTGVDVSSVTSTIDQANQSVDSTNSTISSIRSIYDTLAGNVEPDSNNPVENTMNTIKDLFAELHFNTMATTLQGDQYLKGWNTGGRSEADIKQDILTLLNNDQQMFNDISQAFETIMQGLSGKVQTSATQMINATFQKDSMMASMKSIHEMTMGFDQFVSNLGQKDLSNVSLSKLSSDVDESLKMLSNFQALSTDFIVGEHTLTHLDEAKVKSMINELLPRNMFPNDEGVNHFTGLMTDYVMHRLEHKNIVDSKENEYGTIHLDNLSKMDLKDQALIKMDEFKQLNNDKTTDFKGRVKSRGPFNRAFHVFVQDGKPALESFLRSTSNPTFGDIEAFIGDLTKSVNTIDSNQIDKRSEVITQLSSYTMSLLKKNGVIATGDSGLIKGSGFTLISKKSEFKQSKLNELYGEQFNKMAPILESSINATLKTGLEQGQVGKLRGIVNDLKSQKSIRKDISENLDFKVKLSTNRFKGFFSNTSDSLNELKEIATNVNETIASITQPEARSKPNDVVDARREQLDDASSSVDDGITSLSDSVDSVTDTMVQVQDSVNRLLNSDLSKNLLQIKSSSESDGFNLEKAADSLKASVSSVESELSSLKSILVASGNIALDHVDDVIMSVPYVGELYSAMALAKDIKDGYFANEKMSAMRTQIDTVTGFNHYVASSSLDPEAVPANVEAFANFMHAEKTRNEAAFSLLVHVGNALSPPGVNVGSIMKAVKSAVSLPELQDEDLQSIAKEVMTVNSNVAALAKESKSVGLETVLSTIKHQDGDLEAFTKAIYDVSYHLPTANDFEAYLNQTMFV